MPITKSAKKALRQSITRRSQNLRKKQAYKLTFKNLKKLSSAGKKDEAKLLLPKVYKTLDKAAKRGIIKKNKASRLKSSAMRLLNQKPA